MGRKKESTSDKRPGIKITYISGATKTIYDEDIESGRSVDPRLYLQNDKINKALIKNVEEGDF